GGGCLLACEPLRERTEGGLVALDLRQGLGVLRGQLQLDRQLVADQLGLGVLSALGGSGQGLGGGLPVGLGLLGLGHLGALQLGELVGGLLVLLGPVLPLA